MQAAINKADGRIASLDWGKWVASLAVIMIHLQPSRTAFGENVSLFLWHFTVPLFFAIALYLLVAKIEEQGHVGRQRWRRLLIPYACWSVFYVALRIVKYRIQGHVGHPMDWVTVVLFGGAAVQLYFLPSLIAAEAVATTVALGCGKGWLSFQRTKTANESTAEKAAKESEEPKRRMQLELFPVLILAVGSYLIWPWLEAHVFAGFPAFLVRILGWIPFGLSYLAAGLLLYRGRRWHRSVAWRMGSIICFFGAQAVIFTGLSNAWIWLQLTGVSLAAFLLGCNIPKPGPRWGACLSASFGIYLIHPFWMECLEFGFSKAHVPIPPYSLPVEVSCALLIAALCTLSVFLIRRIPIAALALLGESPRRAKSIK
jgi:surface polysaccharide O-acyltransferase-like enzyme